MKMGMDISWREWLPLLVICGLSILYMLGFYHLDGPPFEDAAMIMRYAENLSAGHGIVWNPGEPPVDGATDFLFMVSVAALHKLGLSPEFAVRLLTLSAHLLTIALFVPVLTLIPAQAWAWNRPFFHLAEMVRYHGLANAIGHVGLGLAAFAWGRPSSHSDIRAHPVPSN